MKPKFNTYFRGAMLLLAVLLFWSVWASAQEPVTPGTNGPAAASVSQTGARTGILNLPVLLKNESYLSFGLDQVPSLQKDLWGNPRWQYVASFLYIVLAFYVSKVLDWLIRGWLKKWAGKTKTQLDDLLLDLLHGPVKVVAFVIFLHIGLRVFSWPTWVEDFLSKGLKLIVAASLTYVSLKAVDLFMGVWRERSVSAEDRALDDQLFPIIRKSLKVFVVILGVLMTCQNLGLNITSIIALGSVGGLAVGLAAQDTLANLFGAISVFIDKPFRVGDRIKLADADGTVESIGLRSTRIRNLEGHLITVPNKTMGSAAITNITQRPNIKTVMNIGITYDLPVEKVKRAVDLLTQIYKSHPKTGDLVVSFDKFADSALNILVVHWWSSTDYKEYIAGMQELNLKVKHAFDTEGISFAFPSSTVYLKQDSAWNMSVGEEAPKAASA